MNMTDKERLNRIVCLWDMLEKEIRIHGITRDKLMEDRFLQWAVTTPVYNIGEQVYQLTPEFKGQHPDVIWNVVSGLRHRLVHDYDGINWTIISDVIFSDMDLFITKVKDILSEMDS